MQVLEVQEDGDTKHKKMFACENLPTSLNFVSGLHNCLEFSQPLSCLYQAMQTRKKFSIA